MAALTARLPTGLCRGCGKPHGRAPHALWCPACGRDAKNANARIARRRREGQEDAPHLCFDCGQPTNRHHAARFCLDCVKTRRDARNRSPRYKRYQAKYRQTARHKLVVAAWNERNKERLRTKSHENYVKRKFARGPKITPCATYECAGAFVRSKSSHRMFCTECQVTFYGRSYLATLARRNKSRGAWTRAA